MRKRWRKIISIFLASIMFVSSIPQTLCAKETVNFTAESDADDTELYPEPIREPAAVTEQGNGTKEKPYKISSEEEFALIAKDPDAHYILASDLVISKNYEIDFSGVFDGNHHRIVLEDEALYGLFDNNSGVIKNVNIEVFGEIELYIGDSVLGEIKSYSIGSICSVNDGIIRDCTTVGSLEILCSGSGGKLYIAGIAGENYSVIERCWNDMLLSVHSSESGYEDIGFSVPRGAAASVFVIGGISGWNEGRISHCINNGKIWSKFSEDDRASWFMFESGGIAGYAYEHSSIEYCIQAGKEIDLDCELVGDSTEGGYQFFSSLVYHLRTGFIAGCEYNFGNQVYINKPKIVNCGVQKDSYIIRDLNAYNYYIQEVKEYLAEETAYKIYSNSEIKSWWDSLERADENESEETEIQSDFSVRFLHHWDAENQTAYFGEFDITGCQVTEDTDTSILDNIESLIGQYVYVESKARTDEMIGPDTLINIKSVDSAIGTLQDFTAETVTIDDTIWNLGKDIGLLFMDMDTEVIYHVCQDTVVGIDIPQITTGAFTGWEESTGKLAVLIDNPQIFTVNENADSSTFEQLKEIDIFATVTLTHDVNNKVYRVDIKEESKESGYHMKAYSVNQDLTIGIGNHIDILCSLFYDGEILSDWEKPAFSVSNSDVVEVVGCEKIESGYEITLEAIKEGTSVLIITDGNSGAKVAVDVKVLLNEGTPYSYMIDNVRSFYPAVFGDRETQTNVYNCNGLYVNNFPTELIKINDKYVIEFDVYNSLYMNGSVDVYNKEGDWIESYCIDKHTSVEGIWDTAKSAYFLVADGAKRNTFSYTAHSFSEHTHVKISVPEGGYFTIGASYGKCPGTFLYNTIDYMLFAAKKVVGDDIGSGSNKQIYEATLKELLSSQAFANKFFSQFSDIALNIGSVTITGGYGALAGAITEHAGELFEDIDLDFWGIVAMCCGLGEDAFLSMTPAFVGGTLKLMFSFSTLCDMTGQTVQIAHSINKPYITMYTPQATGELTISGVTVCPDEGAVTEQAVPQVFRIANRDALIISDTGLVDVYEEYHISIIEDNHKIQPNGDVTIKIPVPENYVNDECIVLHQQEDGGWQIVDSEIEDGFIVFTVDHFSCFAVGKLPLDMGKCGDKVYWMVDKEGTLVIAGYGAMKDYLWQKDTPWYQYRDQIKTIKIKKGIEYIGEGAFADFDIVKSVEIANTVHEIGATAFAFSDGITEIILPESVTTIGNAAFQDCTKLSKINIPQNVTDIGYSAFRNSILKEVKLPESLKNIATSTFYGCTKLSNVSLPSTLESIGSSAFYGCTGLTSFVIPETVREIGGSVFGGCTKLANINLPDGLEYLDGYVFEGCEALKCLVLPDSIEYIGYECFSGCRDLEELILPENLQEIDDYAFSECSGLTEIVIPKDVTFLGNGLFMSCDNLSIITFLGDAPTFSIQTFLWNNFTAYYPVNDTWTKDVRQDYAGEITWIPMCENHKKENTTGYSASCETNGLTDGQKCSVCGYIFVKQRMIPATGHSFGEYISNSDGTKTRYCTKCDKWETIGTVPVINEMNRKLARISGNDRYSTAYKVADALKEELGIEKFDAVIVATGKNFADALAGSYLSVVKDAPILLTNGKSDNVAKLHDYIKENVNTGGTIYILGGEAAVSKSVELISGYGIKRLSGITRYDTNIEILKEAGIAEDKLIVATGKSFADSLSASASKLPILLVSPGKTLNDEQKEILEDVNDIYIVGGEGAVSESYAKELEAYGTVERVYGTSRYDTSVAVANTFFGDVDIAVVASGKNFPDGLCGGPLAAAMNAPLILTADGKATAASEYMQIGNINSGYVLGGDGALSDETVMQVFQLKSSDEIVQH